MTTIERIVKHPFVSAHYDNAAKLDLLADGNDALRILLALRRQRRNAKAGCRNFTEEAGLASSAERRGGAGTAYDGGYLTQRPIVPDGRDEVARALAAPGAEVLPEDLRTMMADFVA